MVSHELPTQMLNSPELFSGVQTELFQASRHSVFQAAAVHLTRQMSDVYDLKFLVVQVFML